MSGICAIVNFDGSPVDVNVLRAMAESCAYRGPDGIRYWIHGNVGLAHLALHSTPEAIRELQPLQSPDGQLCLVADARVDNRPELIDALAAKGYLEVDDPTDADLILAAYRCWGTDCPQEIIGDFAFVIWDAFRQSLFCARDALGIKSLHYSQVGSTLCVASEAQQILKHPSVICRLDEVSAAEFLARGYWDEERSMFQDVQRLPLANSMTINLGGRKLKRYWDIDPDFRIVYRNDAEYAEHFLEIFRRAVSDRLRSQYPTFGITMSGGLDSTSVAAVAQQFLASSTEHQHLVACSYVYDQLKECDERVYSSKMASDLGIELIYIPAEKFWFLDNDEAYTPSLETPFMTNETKTRYVLNIFKQRNAGVWLTGHGGDGVVTGSPLVSADRLGKGDVGALWKIARYWRSRHVPLAILLSVYRNWFFKPLIPAEVRRLVGQRHRSANSSAIPEWLTTDFIARTQLDERLNIKPGAPHFSDRARQANYHSMVQLTNFLPTIHWAERRAAHAHMEARHPLLDQRMITFILSIPQEQIFHDGCRKFILRNAMKGILPESIRGRVDKTLFDTEIAVGLQIKEVEKIEALFSSSSASTYDIINAVKLKEIYHNFYCGSSKFELKGIWRAISFQLWLKGIHNFLGEG